MVGQSPRLWKEDSDAVSPQRCPCRLWAASSLARSPCGFLLGSSSPREPELLHSPLAARVNLLQACCLSRSRTLAADDGSAGVPTCSVDPRGRLHNAEKTRASEEYVCGVPDAPSPPRAPRPPQGTRWCRQGSAGEDAHAHPDGRLCVLMWAHRPLMAKHCLLCMNNGRHLACS